MFATLHNDGKHHKFQSDQWLEIIDQLGIKGVIFDCDGTLVDSSNAHCLSMQSAAHQQGFQMAREWYLARTGLSRIDLFEAFRAEVGAHFEVARAVEDSIADFGDHIHEISPIKDTVGLFKTLTQKGIPCAIATNAERGIALQSLQVTGLNHQIDVLVSVTDGVPPKPSPMLFELAARNLGLPSHLVMVFEDSPQGVTAALAAGMPVFELET